MQRTINEQSLARTENLIAAIRARRELVFLDEAVFSKRSLINQTWRKPYSQPDLLKAKFSFNAVGVVAAINTSGQVVGCVLREQSIKLDALCEL